MTWRLRLGGAAVLCAAVIAGCASQSDQKDAAEVATQFLEAARTGDTEAACALLTPQTREGLPDGPCEQSLPADQLGGAVNTADTWSDWARVDTDDGTLFLTEFESGWRIDAAGCHPNGDTPYRCVVGS